MIRTLSGQRWPRLSPCMDLRSSGSAADQRHPDSGSGPRVCESDEKRKANGYPQYKPTTPGRRGASVSDFAEITRDSPEKSLLRP